MESGQGCFGRTGCSHYCKICQYYGTSRFVFLASVRRTADWLDVNKVLGADAEGRLVQERHNVGSCGLADVGWYIQRRTAVWSVIGAADQGDLEH
jgi:hypothetical protein